jgi:hypothetical protein
MLIRIQIKSSKVSEVLQVVRSAPLAFKVQIQTVGLESVHVLGSFTALRWILKTLKVSNICDLDAFEVELNKMSQLNAERIKRLNEIQRLCSELHLCAQITEELLKDAMIRENNQRYFVDVLSQTNTLAFEHTPLTRTSYVGG